MHTCRARVRLSRGGPPLPPGARLRESINSSRAQSPVRCRVLWGNGVHCVVHLAKFEAHFFPLHEMDLGLVGSARAMGGVRVRSSGRLPHGAAAGCGGGELRIQRPPSIPVLCRAGFRGIRNRQLRDLPDRIPGRRNPATQADPARAIRKNSCLL